MHAQLNATNPIRLDQLTFPAKIFILTAYQGFGMHYSAFQILGKHAV